MKSIHIILTMFMVMSLGTSVYCQSESYSEYQQCIQAIDHQVVDLTAPSDLFGATNFVAMYTNSTIYLTNAMQYLGDMTNSRECKMIVVYSLQDLPLHNYISYERNLLRLAGAGLLSKSILNEAILTPLDWNTEIELNFNDPDVKCFLQECIQSDLINPEIREYFKKIASGKAKQHVLDLEDAGMLPK